MYGGIDPSSGTACMLEIGKALGIKYKQGLSWTLVNVSIEILCIKIISLIYRVRTGPGKPGKSWNFKMAFSRTGKSWKKASGPEKFWKSVKLD